MQCAVKYGETGAEGYLIADLYTTHVKSINSVVSKCGNELIQWPWIGITSIYQSIQSCCWVHMDRLNQVKRITEMIQTYQSINSIPIYVDIFWNIFYFVDLFLEIPQAKYDRSIHIWIWLKKILSSRQTRINLRCGLCFKYIRILSSFHQNSRNVMFIQQKKEKLIIKM